MLSLARSWYTTQYESLSQLRLSPQEGPALDELLRFIDKEIPLSDGLFVYPEQVLINGLVNRRHSQPLMVFYQGVTYSGRDNSRTDKQILSAFSKGDVDWVVTESQNKRYALHHFPLVVDYIDKHFTKVTSVAGVYDVYRRES